MKTLKTIFIVTIALCSLSISAQSKTEPIEITIDELPEYVIITSENTKLLGGIDISIDSKNSEYQVALEKLETYLQSRKQKKVRNQTDLLNALYILGFEYVDSFNATAGTLGAGAGNDVEIFGSNSKFRTNMIFKKIK